MAGIQPGASCETGTDPRDCGLASHSKKGHARELGLARAGNVRMAAADLAGPSGLAARAGERIGILVTAA